MFHRVLVLVWSLCCWGTWAQSSSAHTECSLSEEHRADVVLLLDGFNHISSDDFSRVRDSLQTLVSMVGPVGPDLVRISLVKCGRDPETEFYLNTFHDLSSVIGAVSRMSQSPPFPGGSTDNAVDFIRRNIFNIDQGHRKKVPKILILITDRNSSGVNTDVLYPLWRNDARVFVVGVNVTNELRWYSKLFTVEDYHSIPNIFKELTQSLCRWLKELLGRAPPESLRFTDVQPRRVRASWECNSTEVLKFDLSVYLDHSASHVQWILVLGHKRHTEIPHLLPNTSYRVTVSAEYTTGWSIEETGFLTTPQDGVQLSGGPGRCSGSVEVLMDQSWSSVCGRDFGLTEAAVVCGELDCGAVSELHQGALFTEGPAVGRSFHCDGAETSLKECESSETRCSTAANLTCSDEVLRLVGFSCSGNLQLRHKDEWRPVTTSVDPDLDFGSVLCEQMGCGSALSVKRRDSSRSFWWLEPECVKQRSGLTDCLALDSHVNVTEGRLHLICSEYVPVVRASVSSERVSVSSEGVSVFSEGISVFSEGVSHVQRVFLKLGENFSVSCSLDEPFLPGQFHLLTPTGNYTLLPVNHSAHFLSQAFSPTHIGNFTCVYCVDNFFLRGCVKSTTLYITPGAMSASEETDQTSSAQDAFN